MALSDKNIVITPNIGAASDPKIVFSGADASTAAQNITLTTYPTNSGTLSFDGSAGQLFSITNSLSGSIFSVNDVSGIPSIEVLDTGTIKLAQYGGNVGIGTNAPRSKLEIVSGSTNTTGDYAGYAGSFVSATPAGQYSTLSLESNDITIAASTGGVLGFGGRYLGTAYACWASIKGLKQDATSGNYGGYLSFFTRVTGTSSAERLRITQNGGISFGATGTAYGTSGQVLLSAGDAPPVWTNQSSIAAGTASNITAYTINQNVGTANPVQHSDITTARASALTTGYMYYGNTGTKYAGFDGTNFVSSMPMSFNILGSSTSCTGNAENIVTPTGGYKHLGAWGVGRTAVGAILVNTAYTADTCSGNAATSSSCSGNAATATNATNTSYVNGTAQTSLFIGKVCSTVDINGANDTGSISVRGDATYPASMSFHRAGAYAINVGLSNANNFVIGGWSASSNAFSMTGGGALTMLNNITAYSDERLKKNWRDLPVNFVERLADVKHGIYDRTDQECTQVGVSAQSLQPLMPDAIMTQVDGMLSVSYGNAALVSAVQLAKEVVLLKEQSSMQSNTIELLIEAIKEQQVQIDELKELINKGK